MTEPAPSRGVVVDAGETSISAVCNYFGHDRFHWVHSQFHFNAEKGRTYRVSLAIDENSKTDPTECMALIDESVAAQVSCNTLNELPSFSLSKNIATGEQRAEIWGDLPLCGVTSPYVVNNSKQRHAWLEDKIVVGPGRLRIYAGCLRHGVLDSGYYRAVFELDVVPGTIYLVRRIDKDATLGPVNSDRCIRPVAQEKPVPVILCRSGRLTKPAG